MTASELNKLQGLEKRLGVKFADRGLLLQALTHRSYLNEHPQFPYGQNERLEFLGDAVLELLLTEYLFEKYPKESEGDLTAYRAASVNTETLAVLAADLGLNEYLLLSKGEARDTGRARETILANTLEAVIGALYLDQGLPAARAFVRNHLAPRSDRIVKEKLWQDAKSLFQEKAQELRNITPTYQVLTESGPEHDKTFRVGLYLGPELVAEGVGSSKQRAEEEAARQALSIFGWSRRDR